MLRSVPAGLAIAVLVVLAGPGSAQTFSSGDLFFATGGGLIQWRDSSGVLIATINTGDAGGGSGSGMRHHPATGELWATNFNGNPSVRIVQTDGVPNGSANTTPFQTQAESIK